MPKCAWILLIALTAILHHAVGIGPTLTFLVGAVAWIFSTPAALVAVAVLAAWHLLNAHTPHAARRRPATVRP
ncbi:hypothetical protein [Streptomyces tauricus]|uniref:hypothetical protein n=1 Tax=Streptomyces tauricus TaxID=68274 RepID=UPI00343A5517